MKRFDEEWSVIGTIDPQTVTSTGANTDVVALDDYSELAFIFCTGNMASETIDAQVESCDSDGSNNATLKAATQLAAHASNNDGKQIIISVIPSDLLASGKAHVRGNFTTGGASGGPVSCVVLGRSYHRPATDNDLASVAQVARA